MSQPFHTPYLRTSFPPHDSLQRIRLYGPKHPDGGEYAPVCEIADDHLARGIAAAYNAFDSAAQQLGLNAVEFAERMTECGIAELVEALQAAHREIRAWRDGINVRSGNMHEAKVGATYASESAILGILAKVRGDAA